jgi:heat shock protein HslJ
LPVLRIFLTIHRFWHYFQCGRIKKDHVMKKTFFVLPLAILLANCSSTRNTAGSTSGTGMNSSSTATSNQNTPSSGSAGVSGSTSVNNSATANASASASTNTASANYGSTSASVASNSDNGSKSAGGSINWDVYDPNNFMQNPEKYHRPDQLGKAGGWTYNKDWRRNTNFTAEAVGQWQLVLTPEVAANWLPDTRRPETYASFWTPEAVMARYEASMAAMQKTRDSLAALTAAANTTNAANSADAQSSTLTNGATGSESVATTGAGSTGSMGTGGIAGNNTSTESAGNDANGNSIIPFNLKAVNGNNFMLPTLNMYIDNGSFTAYTGCNSALGNVIVNGTSLKFEEAAPSTNVECIGGFDQSAFLDRLKRADSYDVVDNQFRLKQGNQVLMVFAKRAL